MPPGRNRAVLDLLAAWFGSRVRTVELTGDDQRDRAAMLAAAEAPIDVVLDMLPQRAPLAAVRTAVMTVRE